MFRDEEYIQLRLNRNGSLSEMFFTQLSATSIDKRKKFNEKIFAKKIIFISINQENDFHMENKSVFNALSDMSSNIMIREIIFH